MFPFILFDCLFDIFGGAFDLPEFISPVCIDINQIIASKLNITDKEAFDLSREELVEKYSDDSKLPSGDKHNSLFDAKVIKILYETFK